MGVVKNKDLITATAIAFLYVLIGTYELVWNGQISSAIRSISLFNRIHLDVFTIFPAHIFGTLFWWILGGGKSETIVFAWIGQLLGLLFFLILFLVLLLILKAIRKKLHQLIGS